MGRLIRPSIKFREPPDPQVPRCAVCRVMLSDWKLIWCAEHRRQWEARQHADVGTDELETRWHDRLAIWRERPPLPDPIGDPAKFRFGRRREGWLLFWCGYPTRLPDWLAINEHTQELRQFVEVAQYEVWNELDGIRPAAYQGDLAERWGNPAPRLPGPLSMSRYDDATGQADLRRLVAEAPMGVYGLVGWPYGLEARGLAYSSNYRGPTSVTLRFVTRACGGAPVTVQIHSADAIFHGVMHGDPEPAPGERVVPLSLNLAGEAFTGRLTVAADPEELVTFRLKTSRTRLSGRMTGLPDDQPHDLLAHLVDLAGHPALVAELQAELHANIAG